MFVLRHVPRLSVPHMLGLALIAGAVMTAGIASGALVQTAEAYPSGVVQKCRGDYKRLCPSYKLESDELDSCMRSQHRAISTPCINALVDNGLAPYAVRRK